MRIDILKDSGFCGGVIRALHILDKTIKENANKNIYMLGPIVHNNIVNKKYQDKGIKIIDFKDINKLNDGDIIVISAHGLSDKKRSELTRFKVIDTTCPFVRKNQLLIKESKEVDIVFIGKKKHSETIALTEDNEKIRIVDSANEIDGFKTNNEGVIYNQTTYSINELENIHDYYRRNANNYKIVNTLCANTINMQTFLKEINPKYTTMIVVGDKESNNANSLFKMSPYKTSHFISNIKDVKNLKLSYYDDIIIVGSASTPKDLLKDIKQEIIDNISRITSL